MAEFLFYSCSSSDAFRQLLWKMPDPMSFSSQNNFFGWISPLKHFEHTEKGNFEQNLCQRKKRDVRITRSAYSTLVWDLEFSDGEWVERRREVRSADSETSGWPAISNNLEQSQTTSKNLKNFCPPSHLIIFAGKIVTGVLSMFWEGRDFNVRE